jgi:hypothetical protein
VVDRGEASDAGGGELSTLRYRVPRGDDWGTTPDIYSYSLAGMGFWNGLSALWQMVLTVCGSDATKHDRELREHTNAKRATWAADALQCYADGGARPRFMKVVNGEVCPILGIVYSNKKTYNSQKPFLNEDRVAEHLHLLAKAGLIFDSSGTMSKTCELVLIDEECDFNRGVRESLNQSSHINALKRVYRCLLLQPFVKALADFEGDPLSDSDEALEWRKQFTVFLPKPRRTREFEVHPALKVASEAKAADRRAELEELHAAAREEALATGEAALRPNYSREVISLAKRTLADDGASPEDKTAAKGILMDMGLINNDDEALDRDESDDQSSLDSFINDDEYLDRPFATLVLVDNGDGWDDEDEELATAPGSSESEPDDEALEDDDQDWMMKLYLAAPSDSDSVNAPESDN